MILVPPMARVFVYNFHYFMLDQPKMKDADMLSFEGKFYVVAIVQVRIAGISTCGKNMMDLKTVYSCL